MNKNESISNQNLSLTAGIFTVLICIFFGANVVAIKYSFNGIGTFTSAAIRFNIAAVVIFLWAKFTGKPLLMTRKKVIQIALLSISFTVQLSLYYLGLSKTSASRGILLVNMHPFILLFLAHFFIPDDKITVRKFAGLLFGFLGLVITFIDESVLSNQIQIGDIIVISATVLWASNTVYIKKIIHTFHPFQIVLYQMIFSVPLFYLLGYIFDPIMVTYIDLPIIGAMFYQGVITASIGFVAWNYLLQRYGAVNLHSFVFIMPISGILMSSILLDETITVSIIVALVCIVAGILIINWKGIKGMPFPLKRGEM